MKKIILFLALILLFNSVFALAELRIEAGIDNPKAHKINILELKVFNDGDTPSGETEVYYSWDCSIKSFPVPILEPGDYKTFVDFVVFPEAGEYDFVFEVDSELLVSESNESNNRIETQFFAKLIQISAETESDLSLSNEPVVQVSCTESDLMGIGRELDSVTGDYFRNSDGILLRDPWDENIWLTPQEGCGCGSTSLAYVLRYMTGTEFDQWDVDEQIRMAWGDGSFSDPFSIAHYAEGNGVHARVYVDGTVEKLEWFLNRNIPVMVSLSTSGSTSVLNGHWVVPVTHCLREKSEAPGTYENVLGIYNPWGYQQEITYERFNDYWGRQDLGEIPLWNRTYIAFYQGTPPAGMPEGNVEGWTSLKMSTAESISQFMVGIQDIGDGFIEMFTEDFFGGLGKLILGIGKAIWNLVVAIVQFVIALIVELFKWLWDVLKAIGCWFYELFGGSCDKTPYYYEHTMFSSHECGESGVFLNGFLLRESAGYVFKELQSSDSQPLFLYKMVSKKGEGINYVASVNPLTEFMGNKVVKVNNLGYSSIVPKEIDLGIVFSDANILVDGSIGYGFSKGDENKALLWTFTDIDFNGFASLDQCAGTRSFPFALSGGSDTIYWIYNRNKIYGYINKNEPLHGIPLFRFYDQKHQTFYPTTDLNEGINKEFSYSSLVGYLYSEVLPLTMTHVPSEGVCAEGKTRLYRYQNLKTHDYFLSTEMLSSTDLNFEGKLGCIDLCPSKCTVPLWEYKAQEKVMK
ncbi:MAG: C39 family peptidase [Candidatus Diapherotrites archaeon]|nr:C39 family peptidase [Candidatus Diapherotrites archaeon]